VITHRTSHGITIVGTKNEEELALVGFTVGLSATLTAAIHDSQYSCMPRCDFSSTSDAPLHRFFITRHSLVRAKGEVFGLLYVCLFVCLFVNDFSTTRGPIHAKVRMQAYSGSGRVFSPFGGWRPPAGGKRGK